MGYKNGLYHYIVNIVDSAFIILRKHLRDLRFRYHLTQEEAAHLTGLSHKHYQSIESGRRKQIWLETVERLAKAYGLSVSGILNEKLPETALLVERPPSSKIHYGSTKRRGPRGLKRGV